VLVPGSLERFALVMLTSTAGNRDRPARLATRSIDPSHYNGIARDVLGAEGTIGFVSADQKTDLAGNSNGPRFENGAIFRA